MTNMISSDAVLFAVTHAKTSTAHGTINTKSKPAANGPRMRFALFYAVFAANPAVLRLDA